MTKIHRSQLAVYLNAALVGHLTESSSDRIDFGYTQEYLSHGEGTPLSLSLPLHADRHDPKDVETFLWGLLPDSEATLGRLALTAGTSSRNVFALLASFGRDTAGALQILRPDVDPTQSGGVEWLDLGDLTRRVAEVRQAAKTGAPLSHDNGQWSLAGAQAKLALRIENGRWGVPHGAEPTTHILKPAVDGFVDFDVHEAVLLTAARDLGLPAARTSLLALEDGTHVLVSQRYDRRRVNGAISRVHQEDFCQALGVSPNQKYESDGGPSLKRIGRLLRSFPGTQYRLSAERLFDALAFNYAIAGTDGHSKNYSLLLSGANTSLAPLYDVNSALPYTRPHGQRFDGVKKLHSAFTHGRTHAFTRIEIQDWVAVAADLGLPADQAIDRVRNVVMKAPKAIECANEVIRQTVGLAPARATEWSRLLEDYHRALHPSVVG